MEMPDVALVLDKHLPVASGIGGGSADAAATLRVLARMTGRPLPDTSALLGLGADVPVCLAGRPVRMRGVGEDLQSLPPLPPFWLVLVNPRVPVPTPHRQSSSCPPSARCGP
jgi:4-diphosphocytidyl-2-C-methyl-D-erythritol kinase